MSRARRVILGVTGLVALLGGLGLACGALAAGDLTLVTTGLLAAAAGSAAWYLALR